MKSLAIVRLKIILLGGRMWRCNSRTSLSRSLALAAGHGREPPCGLRTSSFYCSCRLASSPSPLLAVFSQTILSYSSNAAGNEGGGNDNRNGRLIEKNDAISFAEAKKLMRLVNVEALKTKLGMMEGKEVICYTELLKACESMGVARSPDEAAEFAKVLDDAGVILLFRDKVYLHPDKVVDLVRRSVPLALTAEDDPRREELKLLLEKKDNIDKLAHKQVRRILWSGLGLAIVQVGLFFRLTFWEFSWDVMEPIAFFTTTTGIVIGYAYFLFTSRDPTYQDLMKRLFLSRQRKLLKKHNFDVTKFKELLATCKSPIHTLNCNRKKLVEDLIMEDA